MPFDTLNVSALSTSRPLPEVNKKKIISAIWLAVSVFLQAGFANA
jgi:hypothetical protein